MTYVDQRPAGEAVATFLDPEIDATKSLLVVPDLNDAVLPAVRAAAAARRSELSDDVIRTDHAINDDVIVRVHRPRNTNETLPCVYSIHGGGYVAGTRDLDDVRFDAWCAQLGIIGVSVEYRLAPEHPYPTPLDDCYAGLLWTHRNATELGINPQWIGITGVSAGGGLCAALALRARDCGEIPIPFMLLDSPMLDDRQITASSSRTDLIVWSAASNEYGWHSYLGSLYDTDEVPVYAAPARAELLTGLPATYLSVGSADGFRDEDIAFAQRLCDAGVPTELHVYPGAPHGLTNWLNTAIAQRYAQDQTDWLRRQIGEARPDR